MQGKHKRILIPVVGQGSIIHIIRTGMLDALRQFCEPVVALLWYQPDLVEELQQKGYEVLILPAYKVSDRYLLLRQKINLWHLRFRVKTPSVAIQKKYLAGYKQTTLGNRVKRQVRERAELLRFRLSPSYINTLTARETQLMQDETVYDTYRHWLAPLQVDGLFTVTPFLPEVDLLARLLQQQGKPMIASIHSFDNVTKRGWQHTRFDHYIVWNKYNKAELLRIHTALCEADITIAGAPQFDFHHDPTYTWRREEWLQKLHIPAGKKVILYSGGPVSLLPDEPQYLLALKQAFEQQRISGNYVVLFRCHPLDRVERWKDYVGESPFIVYDSTAGQQPKLDHANVTTDYIPRLISTLKHTELHINVVSTMCVDGSVFDKPQLGPYYDEVHPESVGLFRQMYYQEHYRPIMASGVVNLAHSRSEYIELINKLLEQPDAYNKKASACVSEIITFSDGAATARAVDAIHKFFQP